MATKRKAQPVDGCTRYAQDVVAGKYEVCQYVRQACARHIADLSRSDGKIWYDAKAAERFFKFCGYLRHYKGEYTGRPIELLPWQQFVFGNIYGWKRLDPRGEKTDTLRFNYAYVEVPRKHGKSTLAAAIAAYDCAMLEPSGAEVYIAATREEQAKIVWRDVKAYIKGSADAAAVLEVLEGKSTIYARGSGRTSFIKALGHNHERMDGLNPVSVICDELHAWEDRALWDVLDGAFGARRSWHMIAITTAGSNVHGICYSERKHLLEVLAGVHEADNKFGVVYTLDTGEDLRWNDPAMWAKANPSLGCGKEHDFMSAQAAKAKQEPSSLNAFLQKQLNIWTDATDAWLSMDDWRACVGMSSHEDLRGKKCFAGMDLARVGDLSAVAYYFPAQAGLPMPRLVCDFYLPADEMPQREDRDKVPYSTWVRDGWITTTPGRTTDFEFIRYAINERRRIWDVDCVSYDRHFAGELVQSLVKDGVKMTEHGQGFVSMSAPAAAFERLVVSHGMRHDGNPVLAWNVSNAVIVRDPANNIKPDKSKSTNRIDGVVAAVMTLSQALGYGKVADQANRWQTAVKRIETRGVVFC